MPRQVSADKIESAVAETEARLSAEKKVREQRPSLNDYISEGVVKDAVVNEDGTCNASIEGHENVVRALQMNERANMLAAWHSDNIAESSVRRDRREARAEAKARKRHRPRASIVVPEMPWKKEKAE